MCKDTIPSSSYCIQYLVLGLEIGLGFSARVRVRVRIRILLLLNPWWWQHTTKDSLKIPRQRGPCDYLFDRTTF